MDTQYTVDQRGENISFSRAVGDLLKGMFSFSGYTTRAGYFYGLLATEGLSLLFILFSGMALSNSLSTYSTTYNDSAIVSGLSGFGIWYILAIVIQFPNLASMVRRARDAGLTTQAVWIIFLISFIPYVNIGTSLFVLYVALQGSGALLRDGEATFFFRSRSDEIPKSGVDIPIENSVWFADSESEFAERRLNADGTPYSSVYKDSKFGLGHGIAVVVAVAIVIVLIVKMGNPNPSTTVNEGTYLSSEVTSSEGLTETSSSDYSEYYKYVENPVTQTQTVILDYKDSNGYTYKVTVEVGQWMKGSDVENLQTEWQYFGNYKAFDTLGLDTSTAIYLMGSIRYENTTQGFDAKNISNKATLLTFLSDALTDEYEDLIHKGESSAYIDFSTPEYGFESDTRLSFNPLFQDGRTEWGPVSFLIGFDQVLTPNYPSGLPGLENSRLVIANEGNSNQLIGASNNLTVEKDGFSRSISLSKSW